MKVSGIAVVIVFSVVLLLGVLGLGFMASARDFLLGGSAPMIPH